MKSEKFDITVYHKGQPVRVPVKISHMNRNCKISAVVDGFEITYIQDPRHDGLYPTCLQKDFDMELLYRIGNEIAKQRLLNNFSF
ncbi:hypothetical protein [Chitinophaga defluvii]|uniref:Uncharacterized protein n=1 Tax=Chitinophaga defluvii TaxID=3163343 RepID=A0ABV2T151_9BACT